MSQSPVLTFKVHRYSPVDMKGSLLNENQETFIKEPNNSFYQENGLNSTDRRDSGFHTLTRTNGSISVNNEVAYRSRSSLENGLIEKDYSNQNSKPFTTQAKQIRSSPLIFNRRQSPKTKDMKNEENAKTMAHNLFNLAGYNKNDVALDLSKEDEFSILVAQKYMEMFNFSSIKSLEEGLRTVLKKFPLVGETHERARILNRFSDSYSKANPEFLDGNQDAVHALVFAIVLLNTDLHVGSRVGGRKKMTYKQFCSNLSGLEEQQIHYPTDLLRDIFKSIKKKPLPWCEEPKLESQVRSGSAGNINSTEFNQTQVDSSTTKKQKSKMVMRSQSMNKPSNANKYRVANYDDNVGKLISHPGSRNNKVKTLPRKQGVLWRKSVVDSDGNKTVKRKRKWKLMMVALQGLELHLAKKDSMDASKISLHHCLAETENKSNLATSRTHVFRVTLANNSAALYQTSSDVETKVWVNSINKNAALLSAAPLSAGVGSDHKFQKPLQPSSCSTLPIANQLQNHEERLTSLRTQLTEAREKFLAVSSSQYNIDRKDFLEWEVKKYGVYATSLREMCSSSKQHSFSPLFNVQEEDEDENGKTVDSHSLLSVSPSEPGARNPPGMSASSSTATVTDLSDSVGDLLNHSSSRKPYPVLRSPLSPTSSLPNLLPVNTRGTPPSSLDPAFTSSTRHSTEFPFDLVPKVSETRSGNNSVTLVRSSDGSSNSNNSNNHVTTDANDFSTLTPMPTLGRIKVKGNPGYATTGRIERRKCLLTNPEPARYSMAFLDTNVDVKHVRDHVITTARSVAIETSYLTNTLPTLTETTRGQNMNACNLHPNVTTRNRKARHTKNSTPPPPVVSRMKGRKERKGTARYSYLQAVHDTTKESSPFFK